MAPDPDSEGGKDLHVLFLARLMPMVPCCGLLLRLSSSGNSYKTHKALLSGLEVLSNNNTLCQSFTVTGDYNYGRVYCLPFSLHDNHKGDNQSLNMGWRISMATVWSAVTTGSSLHGQRSNTDNNHPLHQLTSVKTSSKHWIGDTEDQAEPLQEHLCCQRSNLKWKIQYWGNPCSNFCRNASEALKPMVQYKI